MKDTEIPDQVICHVCKKIIPKTLISCISEYWYGIEVNYYCIDCDILWKEEQISSHQKEIEKKTIEKMNLIKNREELRNQGLWT